MPSREPRAAAFLCPDVDAEIPHDEAFWRGPRDAPSALPGDAAR